MIILLRLSAFIYIPIHFNTFWIFSSAQFLWLWFFCCFCIFFINEFLSVSFFSCWLDWSLIFDFLRWVSLNFLFWRSRPLGLEDDESVFDGFRDSRKWKMDELLEFGDDGELKEIKGDFCVFWFWEIQRFPCFTEVDAS